MVLHVEKTLISEISKENTYGEVSSSSNHSFAVHSNLGEKKNEHRAKSNEKRAKSYEQRVKSNEK